MDATNWDPEKKRLTEDKERKGSWITLSTWCTGILNLKDRREKKLEERGGTGKQESCWNTYGEVEMKLVDRAKGLYKDKLIW